MNLIDKVPNLKKVTASEYAGPCPKCGGRDRFHVWPGQGEHGSYWCRQCDAKGDAIQYLREFEGMGFKEACEAVGKAVDSGQWSGASRNMVTPPKDKFTPKPSQVPGDIWQEKARKFVEWAHEMLISGRWSVAGGQQNPIEWLAARGINEESVKTYKLGWNPGEKDVDFFREYKEWGLPEERNAKGNLKKVWLPVGVVIPNIRDGIVQKIRIRRFEDHSSTTARTTMCKWEPNYKFDKYVVVKGGGDVVFIADRGRGMACHAPTGWVIVENYLDAMLVEQEAGDMVGAMAMGSCSTRPTERAFNILKGAVCILNALDYDLKPSPPATLPAGEGGQRQGEVKNPGGKAGKWWKETFPETCERWPVPRGKDPGDAFKQGVNIREWITAGVKEFAPVLLISGQGSGASGQLKDEGTTNRTPATDDRPLGFTIIQTATGRTIYLAEDAGTIKRYRKPGEAWFTHEEIKNVGARHAVPLPEEAMDRIIDAKELWHRGEVVEPMEVDWNKCRGEAGPRPQEEGRPAGSPLQQARPEPRQGGLFA